MTRPAPRRRAGVRLAGTLAFLAVATLANSACTSSGPAPASSVVMLDPAATAAPMGVRDVAYSPVRPAPPLQLTDQDGNAFDLKSLLGTPTFVFFGYTHCTDICPTTLADLRAAIQSAGLPAKVVFVTVDPARDGPAAMKAYLDLYKAGFIGLTGTADQIASAAAAWGVSYHAEPADSTGNYEMVHTDEVYLVDAKGMLRDHIFYGAGSPMIDRLLKQASG